jgi:ribonuclease HI
MHRSLLPLSAMAKGLLLLVLLNVNLVHGFKLSIPHRPTVSGSMSGPSIPRRTAVARLAGSSQGRVGDQILHTYEQVLVCFDGASRHNLQGPAGCAFVCYALRNNGTRHKKSFFRARFHLGSDVSSSQAEYSGLLKGLQFVIDYVECKTLYINGDAETVINQVMGFCKVQSQNILPYYKQIVQLLGTLECECRIKVIPREQNVEANSLARLAADGEFVMFICEGAVL